MQPLSKADEFKNIMRLPLTMESLDSRGLYIYDDGFRFVLWFGRMLSPDIAMSLLGPDAAAELSKVCPMISNASKHHILMLISAIAFTMLWSLGRCNLVLIHG